MAISKKTEAKKTEQQTIEYDVQVTRARQLENGSITFDLLVNGVAIYGCWYKENKDGKGFTSFPSRKGSDGKYYSWAWFNIDATTQASIEGQIESKLK